jgi:hypothetical protein
MRRRSRRRRKTKEEEEKVAESEDKADDCWSEGERRTLPDEKRMRKGSKDQESGRKVSPSARPNTRVGKRFELLLGKMSSLKEMKEHCILSSLALVPPPSLAILLRWSSTAIHLWGNI